MLSASQLASGPLNITLEAHSLAISLSVVCLLTASELTFELTASQRRCQRVTERVSGASESEGII